jgi:predicted DNA-binding transcriptional regulator YafY
MSAEVLALFDAITQMMPFQRRKDLSRQRGLIQIDLKQRDSDTISDDVRDKISQACMEHRVIEFDYHANRADGLPVVHRVEPSHHFFEDGHYYLAANCIETRSTNGTFRFDELRWYRMGRIKNVQLLPDKFVPRRNWKAEDLIYELTPAVARLGVTEHFEGSIVELRADGSAVVRARSRMLFMDLRVLLHYGAGCRVVGGEVATREMKKIVEAMVANYT